MPTDKLEDFILQNRESFDDEAPAPNLWDRIETPRLEGRVFAALSAESVPAGATTAPPLRVVHRGRRIGSILGIAATLLLLLAAAFTLGNNRGYRTAEADLVAQELERIDPNMADAEQYYRSEIAAQFTKVDQASDDPQLLQDLAAIDEATQEIRAALLEVPESQRPDLVNKLIDTYRTKLDILLKVQEHLPSVPTESRTTTQTETNEL